MPNHPPTDSVPICPGLFGSGARRLSVKFANYQMLHQSGKHLIESWFKRSLVESERSHGHAFEPLIFAWFSFNGWSSCVTESDVDRDIIKSLGHNRDLYLLFDNALKKSTEFRRRAEEFHTLWPIFDAKGLRRKGINRWALPNLERPEMVNEFIRIGADRFSPGCWKSHRDAGEAVPLDWPHTLAAIYKVRCNLFHGEKGSDSETDREIVSKTYLTLSSFISKAGLI